MQIFVNNQLAALKKGTSFDYISENRLFSGSDGYTLTITFPLKDCPENLAIFGHINRADVAAQKVVFDCEIRDKRIYLFGCITITEISESEVKTQFLKDRSEQNFNTKLDDIFINELTLGYADILDPSIITPSDAWNPSLHENKYVCLPWVNDASGNIQNCPAYVQEEKDWMENIITDPYWKWDNDTKGLSWQPYLLWLTKLICVKIGYSYDFLQWEEKDDLKYLLICNTLPYAWYIPEFARALPHWNIPDYFNKLELFLDGEFDIDHRAKKITFRFTKNVLNSLNPIVIDDIIEEHSTEISVDNAKCEYLDSKNLVYKDCDHEMWNYYSCDWFLKSWNHPIIEFNSLDELLKYSKLKTWDGSHRRQDNYDHVTINSIFYIKNLNMHFVIRPLRKNLVLESNKDFNTYSYDCILQPLNLFGGRIVDDSDNANEVEIEFIPAYIDDTEEKYGRCLFLSFNEFDEDKDDSGVSLDTTSFEDRKKEHDNTFYKTHTINLLETGKKDNIQEYYNCIYVGYWDGNLQHKIRLPYPNVDNIIIQDDWSSYYITKFSLRINDILSNNRTPFYNLDTKTKTTFKFLADNIPNVRSLFIIRGKRYVCEKLTFSFTENGMSNMVKGIFWPIID